eukprot:TRINITY_DN121074_c0_g1_i1.p1 TRINITY_DN121074_c0_g1~~TRINITY_DN121074_c0_g1_i1.p1  ORF type:complete len:102 (+),score=19.53 TRINITY_DN121074_c0_g1_i1:3-308(+)
MAETLDERRRKDAHVQETVAKKLEETGEKDRLKEVLKAQLMECGWFDDLKRHTREVIKSKGLEKITVDDLVADITPRGRATVPDHVKAEMLTRIRKFLQAN